MENNGDLTWGHGINQGMKNLYIRLESLLRGEICQRCALPAELQPQIFIPYNLTHYKRSVNLLQRNISSICVKCCLKCDKGTNGSVLPLGRMEIINKKYNTLAIQ